MNKRRFVTALLSFLTVASVITACGDSTAVQTPESGTGTAAVPVETEPVNERLSVKDGLPSDLDFGGRTFTIFTPNDTEQADYYKGPDEETGEVVDDAVIARNRSVEERLNISLAYQLDDTTGWDTIAGIVNKYIMSGETGLDLIMGQEYGITQALLKGGFVNCADLQYVDYSQPWWNEEYMQQMQFSTDKRYLLVGDFFINVVQMTHVLYYNRNLYAQYYDNADELYEMVLDGTWTLDRMINIIKEVYVDLNNDGKTDADDQLGYTTYLAGASVDPFAYCGDVDYTAIDENGYVTITLLSDRAVTLTEKVVGLFNMQGSYFKDENIGKSGTAFEEGRAMFRGIQQLSSAKGMRDMKDDFGFLPYPKLDEEQSRYYSVVADIALLGCVPGSSQNLDITGAVLEALCAETYRSVMPAWYEEALKIKYTRDNVAAQIIDIIHDSSYANFIFAYSSSLNNCGQILRSLVSSNKTDYASAAAKLQKSADKALAKIIAKFEEEE